MVRTFEYPQQAVDYLVLAEAAADVGLVLCDVRMPLMNGFDVLQKIRERNPTMRIYMLSSSTLEEDKGRAIDLGATGYLEKLPATEVLAKIITATCG